MATYKVTREGYRATLLTDKGEARYSRLFPRCDFNILERACERAVKTGEALSYSIDWVSVETDAG